MAKKKSPKKDKKLTVPKGPRQKPLPGMANRAIEALDDAALHYDEVKKARMKLTEQEVEAKREVQTLMHARKKTHYHHGNIVIDLVPEGEKVKVKITSDEDEVEELSSAPTDEPEPDVVDEAEEILDEEEEPEEYEEEVPELG